MTAPIDTREDVRAAIVARYGSEAAALSPCDRECALRDATWSIATPGEPEVGPSLMGWRDGPASSLPAAVRRDVSAAIALPASIEAAAAEAAYWTERAEVRDALGGPPLPVWVRARRAILTEILADVPRPAAPPASPKIAAPIQEPSSDQRSDGGQDPAAGDEAVQSGQPQRTREGAREAVRALLGENLTDREIARRVGVSPSTVASVRKLEAEKVST